MRRLLFCGIFGRRVKPGVSRGAAASYERAAASITGGIKCSIKI